MCREYRYGGKSAIEILYISKVVDIHSHCKLEVLRERRPPWPRQIITPILCNVKMLSLGGER